MRLSTVLCAAGFTCFASVAMAKDPNPPGKFFVGVDAGTLRAKASMSPQYFQPQDVRQNDDATAYKVRAGFQFMRYLAVEGGYADLGTFDLENVPYDCPPGVPGTCTYDINSNTKGYFMNVVGTWPITDKLLANGRAGFIRVKNVKRERAPDIAPADSHASLNSTGAVWGLGLAYRMSPHVDAELSWTYYKGYWNDNGLFTQTPRFDLESSQLFALGMRYRF